MCPIPNLPLIGENMIICSNKKFKEMLIFEKKIHITLWYLIKYLLNIWKHGKNCKICKVKNTEKDWTDLTFGHSMDLNGNIFLFQRLFYKKQNKVEKNKC